MRNIIVVNFEQGKTEASAYNKIWQYDYGQTLRIQGLNLPRNVEIHFATQRTGGIALPRVGVTRDGVTDVVIPDSMLENGDATSDYPVYAFVYLTDETSGQTEYMIRMQIKSRPRPEVPGGSEDPGAFHEAVQEVRKLTEKATESERQAEGWAHGREDLPERAEDNAKYYAEKASEDAKKTTADRTAVESVVQNVTQIQGDVARDLEQVQKLAGQAQTSATNAALSEQAAKTSETNAQTAQAGAETAEANAELAERNTKTSEQAIEKAKQLVTQMGQEVLNNKNHVDQTVQEFTLTTQQALADVNNAGQTQTERVQSVGEAAVESVKTAQDTATKAVETAKTEAVKAVQTEGTTQTGNVSTEGEKQVQAVQMAAQEIVADRQQIQKNKFDVTTLKEDLKGLVPKQQGVENANKILGIGEDGIVYAKKMPVATAEKTEIITNIDKISNKYLNSSGNPETLSNYTLYLYSVRENESVNIKGNMKANPNVALRYAFYSKSEIVISNLIQRGSLNAGGWNDDYNEDVDVPHGATILVVSNQNAAAPKVTRKYTEELLTLNQSWLYKKKLGIVGDSMAKGNGTYDDNCWPERIANRNNMVVDNQAINGKYLTQGQWGDSVIGGQVDKLSSDCDIVIVYGGTNDITAHIPIGDYDSQDTTTLNGTMNVLIPKLKNKFPKARVLFITPYRRYNRSADGNYTEVWDEQLDWIDALNKKCNENGIPCWNNALQGQVAWNNDEQRKALSGDGTNEYGDDYHLNNDGLEFVSYLYEQFVINSSGNTRAKNISDDYIYSLIDKRLGVIENGTY